MAQRFLCAFAVAPLAAAGSGNAPDMSGIHGKCYALLQGMSASRYSQAELSMLCRAKLPVEVCRATAKDLGEKPWSPSAIGRTCGKWEEQWSSRMLLVSPEERHEALEDWEAQVDDIMMAKAAVGICSNKTVDECAVYKRDEYPKYAMQLNDAMKQKHDQWAERDSATERDVSEEALWASAGGKFEVLEAERTNPTSWFPALGLAAGAGVFGLAGAFAARKCKRGVRAAPLAEANVEDLWQSS